MEPETTLPSRLPALSTPTSPLGHRGAVFPALEGSLPIRGRQKPSLAPPPCLLTSHATPSPNLVIGLGLPHSSHLALGSPLQPTTSQKNSYLRSGFQSISNQQHDTRTRSALLGENFQGLRGKAGTVGEPDEGASVG